MLLTVNVPLGQFASQTLVNHEHKTRPTSLSTVTIDHGCYSLFKKPIADGMKVHLYLFVPL